MPQYCILRFAKHKGCPARAIEAHHERQKENYASNPDVKKELSDDNIHIIKPKVSYRLEIDGRIKKAGCRTRKDSTRFVDTLITASPEFFSDKTKGEIKAYYEEATALISEHVGPHNIFSAVVHMDEKTPHLHLCFVPLTMDGRLSAKDILGNKAKLSQWQDEFHSRMVKSYPDLERGESSRDTGRRHIPTRVFKQAVRLSRQVEQIKAILAAINPLNAGKKREEVLELMAKFFSDMEDFATQVRRYNRSFEILEQ